jgi:hypothetical protein
MKNKQETIDYVKSALENEIPVYYCNLKIVEVKGKTVRTENDNKYFIPWHSAIYFNKSFNEARLTR